jgi:hypothetical protein
MRNLGLRLQRILASIRDPISYRLLLYILKRRGISLENNNPAPDLTGNFEGSVELEAESRARLPKIIFHTWNSKQDLANNYLYWRRSFIEKNTGYTFVFWDTLENREFIKKHFSWFLDRYDSYADDVFRANIVRLFFLYAFGGFSVHMDSECLKPLDEMSGLGDVLLGRMGNVEDFEHSVPNAVMASKPKQTFWLLAIALAMERLAEVVPGEAGGASSRAEWLTGAILIKDAADFYLTHGKQQTLDCISRLSDILAAEAQNSDYGKLTMLASPIWCPMNWNNSIQTIFRKRMFKENLVVAQNDARGLFPQAFIVTYWSAPWGK